MWQRVSLPGSSPQNEVSEESLPFSSYHFQDITYNRISNYKYDFIIPTISIFKY